MNDLRLTELLLDLKKEALMMSDLVRDGSLDTAFIVARNMQKQLDAFMDRCNEIRWPAKK